MLSYNFCTAVDINLMFEFIKLRKCVFDVVEFDKRLEAELIKPTLTSGQVVL